MMEAKELRSGNLVKIGDDKEYEIVEDVITNPFELYIYGNINYNYSAYAEPIPLTSDWLIRLGFGLADSESDFTVYEIESADFQVKKEGPEHDNSTPFYVEFGDNFTKREVKYIHQLQNLYYALSGEELEVKL